MLDSGRCAAEIQRAMIDREAETAEDRRIAVRVAVNLGDVIVEEDDIYGDGVNIAARLEVLAEPGKICVCARSASKFATNSAIHLKTWESRV
jgi:adenylate cyclase